MHACRVHYYCLGVSQSCNNYYNYNHPNDDRTLLMVEADCVEFSDALGEPDCDCDNFDADTATGTFTCRLTTRDDVILVSPLTTTSMASAIMLSTPFLSCLMEILCKVFRPLKVAMKPCVLLL